ncbi:TPA: gp53-like domain-containing protein [Escherichia coli]
MATNNFKAFALDPNANVMSQADWEALPALLSGFTAGKASSAQVNKAIRQATTIAALVGQFIANSGVDALDNADVNGLVTKFTNALTTNLGLGTASKRNVGTGANQIPDMSAFASGSGYQKLPGGYILQWGSANAGNSASTGISNTFPIPFPSGIIIITTGQIDPSYTSAQQPAAVGISSPTLTGFIAKSAAANTDAFNYLAIGY